EPALGWLEHRQRNLAFALVVPAQLHTHATLDISGGILHTNDVGHDAETLIEVHIRYGVGAQFGKGRVAALHDDRERVDATQTPRNTPGGLARAAFRTVAARVEDHGIALVAGLIGKLVALRGLPEGLGVWLRKAGLRSWCCHGLVSPQQVSISCLSRRPGW